MTGPQPPRSCLARVYRTPMDVEAEKHKGWHRHGILVVAADDERLSWPERELIDQLGARLYGARRRKEARHG